VAQEDDEMLKAKALDETLKAQALIAEREIAGSGPALLANRFFVTLTPSGARLAFTERGTPEGQLHFRNAVILSYQDAISLYQLLRDMLKPVEDQISAANSEKQ
jgi:hypothetical protein